MIKFGRLHATQANCHFGQFFLLSLSGILIIIIIIIKNIIMNIFIWNGRGEKSAKFWDSHPLGPHPWLWPTLANPILASPFGTNPFQANVVSACVCVFFFFFFSSFLFSLCLLFFLFFSFSFSFSLSFSRGPLRWIPPPDRPKFRFFSLFLRNFHSFFPLLGVLSWNFGGVFEAPGPEMCAFGLSHSPRISNAHI